MHVQIGNILSSEEKKGMHIVGRSYGGVGRSTFGSKALDVLQGDGGILLIDRVQCTQVTNILFGNQRYLFACFVCVEFAMSAWSETND